jgi:peptidoglycan/LPS O-acetylase OafA/YrhL
MTLTATVRNRRFPSLDGWRAVSIVLVLGDHSIQSNGYPKRFTDLGHLVFEGNLGVRFFFVISGFLITYLLYDEYRQTGNISLRNFYLRRAIRILPVYTVYLLVLFLLQVFTSWRQPLVFWIGNLTFTTNFIPWHLARWPTEHFWSLAVEEQFYVLWPLLFVSALLKRNERAVYCILGIPLIAAPICRQISMDQQFSDLLPDLSVFQWCSALNYFDSLAIGCIAAILLTKYEPQISAKFSNFKLSGIVLGLTLIIVPIILHKMGRAGVIIIPLGNTFQAIGFAMLLLRSILSPDLFKPLNWPAVKTLGTLSYSIYVWQQIFCANPATFGFPNFWFMSFPGWLLAAGLVATISYYGLEKPLLGLRARLRQPDSRLK